MNVIPINYAERIIEPFWDSGESYPEHFKYSRLDGYRITFADGAICSTGAQWVGNNVDILKQPEGIYAVSLEKECDIDIKEFDILRLCVAMSSDVKCRITCIIDGEEKAVAEFCGTNNRNEFDGKISGEKINLIRLEFMNVKDVTTSTVLYWLGIVNSAKEAEMKSSSFGFTDEWEGCFEENYEISPSVGLYFDNEGLEALRQKIKKPQFAPIMEELRKRAEKRMSIIPEEYIGEYYVNGNGQVARAYEYGRTELSGVAQILAFVGIVDKNREMLKLACRTALSISCCKSWEDNFMCDFPGSTWSRRSFAIESCAAACAAVLDMAGNMLTWHGKNIIYQAIIMKGLPRIEADFKTVEYIRKMNQGISFSRGRIAALIALSGKYPRYKSLLCEAENDLREMIEAYITGDGGVTEGASYWQYTIRQCISSLLMLSNYHKKPLREIVPDALKRTEKFGLAALTDAENYEILPFNDAHNGTQMNLTVIMLYCIIGKSDMWKTMYKKLYNPESILKLPGLQNLLILAPEIDDAADSKIEDFISVDDAGLTSVRFFDEKIGKVHLTLLSGETYFSHTHEDKGSFVLEVEGKPILIERGMGDYSSGGNMSEAQKHNLLCPIGKNGAPLNQPQFDANRGGRVIKAEKKDGVFSYVTDVTDAWKEGVFECAVRSVEMKTAGEFTVTDAFCYKAPLKSMFVLNTYGNAERVGEREFKITYEGIEVSILTQNWTPDEVICGEYGTDGARRAVNRLCLMINEVKEKELITLIKIKNLNIE